MTALQARRVARAALPVIDISGLLSDAPADRAAVGTALRAACLDKGFFYITGHGVPDALPDAVFAEAARFFALPEADKLALDRARSKGNRGYERMRGQTLEAGSPPDLKEGYYCGPEHRADDPRVLAGKFNHGPNQWPSAAALPTFRATMLAYTAVMLDLGQRLMRGLALSLDLPEDHFRAFTTDVMATLRILHYPPQPADAHPDEKGAGAHTDFGGITLLRQDDNGGLQVWDQANDGWIHAEPLPGTYVVNLGDMIARWTNDRYRSTRHRVVNLSGRERYSIPFFYVGNYDHVVECLSTCLAEGETPKYPPTTVEAHLKEMYRRTYG
jgi:isopenicillin N synthase-like dioxygenase